jgi:hypothetical protein
MKQLLIIFTLCIFILSCGQNDTKQKELELRERELALKEKELALKQQDTLSKQTTTVVPQNTATKVEAHSDFNTFWADLKKAINDGNQDAVASMVVIPFKDKYTDELSKYVQGMGKTRTSNSILEFKNNFSRIFSKNLVNLINSNKYIGWASRNDLGNAGAELKKGDYFIQNDDEGFLIRKQNGVYKIILIKHLDMTFDAT